MNRLLKYATNRLASFRNDGKITSQADGTHEGRQRCHAVISETEGNQHHNRIGYGQIPKFFCHVVAIFVLGVSPALTQPAPQPPATAEQITIQLLEQEAANYRRTISQLAVQLNAITKERDEFKAKLPPEKPK